MTIHQCGLHRVGDIAANGTQCWNNQSYGNTFTITVFDIIVELYLISAFCIIGLCGNFVSLVVLRKDEVRHHGLFLLQALAVSDGAYLVVALLRYPAKHLINDEVIYLNVQLYVFPLLKITQTICIWMMVLVTVDR